MQLAWGEPTAFGEGEATSPYAHWWVESQPELEAARGLSFMKFTATSRRDVSVELKNCDTGALKDESPETKRRRAVDPGDTVGQLFNLDDGLIASLLPDDVINWRYTGASVVELGLAAPTSETIYVAIIDDGIAFAHERFRSGPATTRFDYVWMQGVRTKAPADHLPFGRELSREDIDGLLRKHTHRENVDEEALYREVGLIDPGRGEVQSARLRATHGTGVLDLAAGYRPGEAPCDIRLVGVSLPSQITHDTSGTFLEPIVVLAMRRVLDRVEALRKLQPRSEPPARVIVLLCYALCAGPKDGSGLLDRFIDDVLGRGAPDGKMDAVDFVLPAGNHRQARTHAEIVIGAEPDELSWHLLPDDRTPSFVEVWSPHQATRPEKPTLICELVPPGYASDSPSWIFPRLPVDDLRPRWIDLRGGDRRFARAYYSWHADRQGEGGRERIVLAVPPTVPDVAGQEYVPPGDWRLRLTGPRDGEKPVHLYIQRDDTPLGYRQRGRQSYFVDGRYEDYDADGRIGVADKEGTLVKRQGTLNALATARGDPDGKHCTVVGAYRRLDRKHMPYSGVGSLADDRRDQKPDQLSPADESPVLRGMITAGTLSGSAAILSGTSVAAPRVVRAASATPTLWSAKSPDDPIDGIPAVDAPDSGPPRRWSINPTFGALV